jgi:L-aminopeptidase/D-esterase-like protein
LIEGAAVRTGVSVVWPRGKHSLIPVFGGWFSLNGNGEMTGTAWIEESGFVNGPILLTNTHAVGFVRDSFIQWFMKQHGTPHGRWLLPVVAETYDGFLNDINGFHIRAEHVVEALEEAHSGPQEEGSVGAGTGTICYHFKAGIGTASRVVREPSLYHIGVLVQANCGKRQQLTIAGVPVGREIPDNLLGPTPAEETGSIIIVVCTDAPLLPHQTKRLARRATMGLARTGSSAANTSGDLFLAFSTADIAASTAGRPVDVLMLPNEELNPLFEAVVEATEEAIINSLVGADTMIGINGNRAPALPLDRLVSVMDRYNRLRR